MNYTYKNISIREKLEAITKHDITSVYRTQRAKDLWTITYYDCNLCKYMKCTLKNEFLISNIREAKDMNFNNQTT